MKMICMAVCAAALAFAQPGQLTPAQPSNMKGANLKPALPPGLEGVGIEQRLNARLPLERTFRDEFGVQAPLSKFFHTGKPVIFAPVYYRCPMLCTQILNGLVGALKAVSFTAGQEFEVVAFSFDPKDTPQLAAAKRQGYLKRYGRPGSANGWHFLSGDEANIKAVMDAAGFRYRYDPDSDQYAHASGVMVVTPEGRVSKYFFGVEYAPRDLRLGLVEASTNKIGSMVDDVMLFCYRYDPTTGKYGAVVMRMVRFAGAGFALIAGAFLFIAFRREWRGDRIAVKRT